MADSTKCGNAVEFDVDLHSIYAAYLGLFESSGIEWWEKSWGGYFATFNEFLGFGWETMIIVDSVTGKPHIAVRREQIALFAKMIRTRFGESLPKDPPTTLPLKPVPTRTLSLRRLVSIHDLAAYRKLSQSLPAAELSFLRSRLRAGEVDVVEQLFYAGGSSGERDTGGVGVRDNGVGYSWACVKTTWWEKGGAPSGLLPGVGRTQSGKGAQAGKGLVLEVGVATLRCANLRAVNVWPPVPAENYRKSHFVVEEWVDKRTNSNPPNYPRGYGFGSSRYVSEKSVEKILDATLAGLANQENDGQANTLILLTIGDPPPLPLPASSTLPANILHLDVLALEFNLLRRAQSQGLPNTPDRHQPLTSLLSLLQTLQIPIVPFVPLGNAGNEAYYTLLAFQKLMMSETRLPDLLFTQPEAYMPGMMYPGYSPFPSSGSMQFQQYPMLPMPPPIGSPGHRRRESSGSRSRGEYAPPSYSSSPSGTAVRRASDTLRQRPNSIGDPLSVLGKESPRRSYTPENQTTQHGSAPSTVRADRQPIHRSQTVFWDDAEYARTPPDQHDVRGRHRESTLKTALKPNVTGGSAASAPTGLSDSTRSRHTSMLPPSSLRSSTGGLRESSSSRSISWEGRKAAAAASAGTAAPVQRSGLSSTSLKDQGGSTGSSTKLSSTSSTDTRSKNKGSSGALADIGENTKVHDKAKDGGGGGAGGGKGKMKGDKSVKDIAGKLARFWVG